MSNWRCVLNYILAKAKKKLRETVPYITLGIALLIAGTLAWVGLTQIARLLRIPLPVLFVALGLIVAAIQAICGFVELIREAKEHCE